VDVVLGEWYDCDYCMSDTSLLSSIRSSFAHSGSVMPSFTPGFTTPITNTAVAPPAPTLTTQDQLDVLSSVLDEIQAASATATPQDLGALAQMVPQTALDSTDTLNPLKPAGSSVKEAQAPSALQEVATETGISLQYVEQEKAPEISPEVESFLQNVEEHHEQAPEEIVIAGDDTQLPSTTHHPSQPVLVLPITPEIEKEGVHANVHWSVRWLVEWSHKIIKVFSGKVIYREA
jgi:hypothetical protein